MGNTPSNRNDSATFTPRASSSRRLLHALGVGASLPEAMNSDYAIRNQSSAESNSSASGSLSSSSPVKPAPLVEYIDGGQTNSFGKLYPGLPDYDMFIVKRFILEKRLAPFFCPLDEIENAKLAEKPSEDASQENSGSETKETPSSPNTSLSYCDPLECPICFMQYPPFFNYTKCCDQSICTECFIQIKRPESTFEPASCPYCVTPNFSIMYQSKDILLANTISTIIPDFKEETPHAVCIESQQNVKDAHIPSVVNTNHPLTSVSKEESSLSASLSRRKSNHPVLTSDDIRPNWKERKQKMELNKILEQQRIALATARRRQMEAFSQVEVANAALFAAHMYEGVAVNGGGSSSSDRSPRRSSPRSNGVRRIDNNQAQYQRAMRYLGADVEELMLLEAMRRSIQDANPPTADPVLANPEPTNTLAENISSSNESPAEPST